MDIDHGHAPPAEETMEYDEEVEMGSAGGAEDPEGDEVMMDGDDDGDAGDEGGEEEYIEADEEEVVAGADEASGEAEEGEEEEMEAEELGGAIEPEVQGGNPAQPESQPAAVVGGGEAPEAVAAISGSTALHETGDGQPVAGPSSPRPDAAGPAQPERETYGEEGEEGGRHDSEDHADEGEEEEVGEQDDDAVHPDMTDYPYPSDSETLPPIVVQLPTGDTRSLFFSLPQEAEGSEAPVGAEGKKDTSVWLEGRQAELAEASIADVWAAVRAAYVKEAKAQLGGGADAEVGDLGEMVLEEKLMALKMGEDDVNLQSITLLELVQLYYSCDLPFPLNLELSFQPNRFIARYNAIKSEIDAQADAEADEGGSEIDEDQEVGEGEEGEHDAEEEEAHHDAQRTMDDEVAAERSEKEDANLPSQSINMNDSDASPVVSYTVDERTADATAVEDSRDNEESVKEDEEYGGEEEDEDEYGAKPSAELPATISANVPQAQTLTSEDGMSGALGGTPAGPPPAHLDLLGEPPLDEKALRDNRQAVEAAEMSQGNDDVDGGEGPVDSLENTSVQAAAGDGEDDAAQEEEDGADDPATVGDTAGNDEAAYGEVDEERITGDHNAEEDQNAEEEQYELESDENQNPGEDDFLKDIADAAVASAAEDEGQQTGADDGAQDAQDEVSEEIAEVAEVDPQDAAAAAAAEDVVAHAKEVDADADALEAKVADIEEQSSVSARTAAEIDAEADKLADDAEQVEQEAADLPDEDELADEEADYPEGVDVEDNADYAGDDAKDELGDADEGYETGQDAEENGEDRVAGGADEPPVSSASKRTFLDDPVVEGDHLPDAKRQKA